MTGIVFYFQVHQPFRLRRFNLFDPEQDPFTRYFDHANNERIFKRVMKKCYLPANQIIRDLINETSGAFRVSYSLTGTFLEQAEMYGPEVIDSFVRLVDTGYVEIFDETYYHSLASLWDREEFREQVKIHREKIWDLFGVKPTFFRNTEGMFWNDLAKEIERMGYVGAVAEGVDWILGWRSPNYVYRAKGSSLPILTRNYRLSDDIAFRFASPDWKEFPLTADKYAAWLAATEGDVINLFMDYETFGEHMWPETGIYEFLRHLPREVLKYEHLEFLTATEAVKRFPPRDELDYNYVTTWADESRDLSAWLNNEMQQFVFKKIQELKNLVVKAKDPYLTKIWRLLQTSDHFYYISTKYNKDGDIHKYFREEAFRTPYDAFVTFINILSHFEDLLRERVERKGVEVETWERLGQ